MKKLFLTIVAALAVSMGAQADNPYKKFTEKLPFAMPEVSAPVIPDYQVKLTDFGAVGDGITLNTEAFAKAIDALSKRGGGKLVVPQGVWHTGPIVLKSNIELNLKAGAVILFAADESLYPIIETSFEGLDTRRLQSPIYAKGATNIAITGKGVIDGNGQYWRPVKKEKVTAKHWKSLLAIPGSQELKPGYWVPSAGYAQGEKGANMNVPNAQTAEEWNAIKRFLRPVMISLVQCKNVMLKGVIFQNSPAWNLHPLMSENIIIDQVLVRNPSYAQNGDALDLESCKNVLIVNSRFDAGDDGICMKGGNIKPASPANGCEDIVIQDNTVFHAHGGFVLGSETISGMRRIIVRHNRFAGTDTGLRFKSGMSRGGKTEKLFISDIMMTDIKDEAIIFQCDYVDRPAGSDPNKVPTFTEEQKKKAPYFQDIHISNVICHGASTGIEASGILGLDNVRDIDIENTTIVYTNTDKKIDEKTAKLNLKNVNLVKMP